MLFLLLETPAHHLTGSVSAWSINLCSWTTTYHLLVNLEWSFQKTLADPCSVISSLTLLLQSPLLSMSRAGDVIWLGRKLLLSGRRILLQQHQHRLHAASSGNHPGCSEPAAGAEAGAESGLLETSDSSWHMERMYVNTRDFKNCVTSQTMMCSHHVRQNSAAVINLRTNNGAGRLSPRRPTCLSSRTRSCWCIFNKVGETAHHCHLSLLTLFHTVLFTCLSLLSLSISYVSIFVTCGEVVALLLVCVSLNAQSWWRLTLVSNEKTKKTRLRPGSRTWYRLVLWAPQSCRNYY